MKYVVHLNPAADATGKDLRSIFEFDADFFAMEEGAAVFKKGAIVAVFPLHAFRAAVEADP